MGKNLTSHPILLASETDIARLRIEPEISAWPSGDATDGHG